MKKYVLVIDTPDKGLTPAMIERVVAAAQRELLDQAVPRPTSIRLDEAQDAATIAHRDRLVEAVFNWSFSGHADVVHKAVDEFMAERAKRTP